MKRLGRRNQELISDALRTVGLDKSAFNYIEERLYTNEVEEIGKFIDWLVDNKLPYGPATAEDMFAMFKKNASREEAAKMLKDKFNYDISMEGRIKAHMKVLLLAGFSDSDLKKIFSSDIDWSKSPEEGGPAHTVENLILFLNEQGHDVVTRDGEFPATKVLSDEEDPYERAEREGTEQMKQMDEKMDEMEKTAKKYPDIEVSTKTGREGPEHDPYSYTEYYIYKGKQKVAMIHLGLAEFMNPETREQMSGEAMDAELQDLGLPSVKEIVMIGDYYESQKEPDPMGNPSDYE